MIFTMHRNGDYFCDLVRDEDRWIELHDGPSDRATEYGSLIDKITVFTDRTSKKTAYD
jgi:hypothetical protein